MKRAEPLYCRHNRAILPLVCLGLIIVGITSAAHHCFHRREAKINPSASRADRGVSSMKLDSQDGWHVGLLILLLAVWFINRRTRWFSKDSNPRAFVWWYSACVVVWLTGWLIRVWRD